MADERPRDRTAQPLGINPGAAALVCDLASLVGRGGEAALRRLPVYHRSIVLARRVSGHFRRRAAHLLFLHGADLRRTALDDRCDLVADDPRYRHRLRGAESGDALFHVSRTCAAVRARRRQLRLVDGQYLLLLSARREGKCARAQCRPRQSRRQRRAVRGADRDHRRRVRLVRRRSGVSKERSASKSRSGCRMRASSGCRSSRRALSPPGSA